MSISTQIYPYQRKDHLSGIQRRLPKIDSPRNVRDWQGLSEKASRLASKPIHYGGKSPVLTGDTSSNLVVFSTVMLIFWGVVPDSMMVTSACLLISHCSALMHIRKSAANHHTTKKITSYQPQVGRLITDKIFSAMPPLEIEFATRKTPQKTWDPWIYNQQVPWRNPIACRKDCPCVAAALLSRPWLKSYIHSLDKPLNDQSHEASSSTTGLGTFCTRFLLPCLQMNLLDSRAIHSFSNWHEVWGSRQCMCGADSKMVFMRINDRHLISFGETVAATILWHLDANFEIDTGGAHFDLDEVLLEHSPATHDKKKGFEAATLEVSWKFPPAKKEKNHWKSRSL